MNIRHCKDCPCFEDFDDRREDEPDGICHFPPPHYSADEVDNFPWTQPQVNSDGWCWIGQTVSAKQDRPPNIPRQTISALIEAMGYTAENMQREALGQSMAYTHEAFYDLLTDYGLIGEPPSCSCESCDCESEE